jgi:hypothetical protein
MRKVSDKRCRESQNTYFMTNNFFFENRAVYEIRWENTADPGRSQMKIRRICIACWITKATNTHTHTHTHTHTLKYVIFVAFPLQQCLHESASMLCYTFSARVPKLGSVTYKTTRISDLQL